MLLHFGRLHKKVQLLFFFSVTCSVLVFGTNCASRQNSNKDSPDTSLSASPSQSQSTPKSEATSSSNSPTNTDSLYSEINNQMSVAELRQRLDEVKAIELEARKLVALRKDWVKKDRENKDLEYRGWEKSFAECIKMMNLLKPRAKAVRDEYKRMLSPAGMAIVNASLSLIWCLDCSKMEEDDCSDARKDINEAERELKKEMRQN